MRTNPLALILVAATLHAQQPRLGSISFPTSGAPAAQPAFIRGVLYLHSFEYDSAAKAFREAQRLDPGFAMAYWGEAMTSTHPVWFQQDAPAARAALARLAPTPAARRARTPTPREQRYLETVEILYGDGSKERRDSLFAQAMGRLAADYPADLEAQAFHALALLGTSHAGRDTVTYLRAATIAQRVFSANPDHPGAAHYLIHAYDDPLHATRGLPAARAYSGIAPGAAHAQHMTSHIFVALGMWHDVVSANERAWTTSGKRNGHYTFWLEYGYLQQGRTADARRFLDAMRADASRQPTPYARGYLASMVAAYLIDTEDWRGPVARWAADSLPFIRVPDEDEFNVAATALDFILARAAIERGERPVAERFLTTIDARNRAARRRAGSAYVPGLGSSEIMATMIRAMLLARDGQLDSAITLLRGASTQEHELPFEFGPPETVKPPNELLGEMLLAAQGPAEARIAFETALQRTPRRARALLGLARARDASGDAAGAAQLYGELRELWRDADPSLPGIREVRSRAK